MNTKELEHEKYVDYWKIPGERRVSPGMRSMPEFLDVARNAGWRRVLDLGCGQGRTSAALIEAGFDVMATDIAPNCLNDDMKVIIGDKFIPAPAWELPFGDKDFDVIFCCDVLEHVPPELVVDTLTEMARVSYYAYSEIASFDRRVSYNKKPLHVHLTVKSVDWWVAQLESVGHEIMSVADRQANPKVKKTGGYAIWTRCL